MQKNPILYIDFNKKTLTNTEMGRVVGFPELIYGSCPTWEIHLVVSDGEGGSVGADLSDAVAWHAAVDTDFTKATTPMVRTLDNQIDHSQAASGIILVPLDTNTEVFFGKIDGRKTLRSTFELRGLDSNDRDIYCYQIDINALGAVDADGGEPLPVVSGGVTLSDVYAIVRQTPLLQYSEDASSWHSSQTLDDLYARVSVSGGDWSDAILLPSGLQGPEGPAGAEISSIIVTTLPSYEPASANFADGTLSLGIPSGVPGTNGLNGDTITGLVVNMIPTEDAPSASFIGGLETLWIPSGAQGPKGEDGSAITGVVVETLPDTSPASASFTDGLLSFGIPSGTPGQDGNPDAVTAVDALPEATSGTVGKAYVLTTTGHTYLGTLSSTTEEHATQVFPDGWTCSSSTGQIHPNIVGCSFTSGGTYQALDGQTYTWYSTTGTDSQTYYLAQYYVQTFSKLTILLTKGIAPSSWNNNTIYQTNAWCPTTYSSSDVSIDTLPFITSWYAETDGDYGTQQISFTLNVPVGALVSAVFTATDFSSSVNGTYTIEDPSSTGANRVWANGQGYYISCCSDDNTRWVIYSSKNPNWNMTGAMQVEAYTQSGSTNPYNTTWSNAHSIEEPDAAVAENVTYWQIETITVVTYGFTDITPSGGGGGSAGAFPCVKITGNNQMVNVTTGTYTWVTGASCSANFETLQDTVSETYLQISDMDGITVAPNQIVRYANTTTNIDKISFGLYRCTATPLNLISSIAKVIVLEKIIGVSNDEFDDLIILSGGVATACQPNAFFRFESALNPKLSAIIAPPEDMPVRSSCRCTLSFNGSVILSGNVYSLFNIDGTLSGHPTGLTRDGIYDFYWYKTGGGGSPSAIIKPIGFFDIDA